MTSPGLPRGVALASALSLALAPAVAEAADAVTCPDTATVQAARLVEFQTMMMGVAVRCRHVGVPIADHLDGMNTARRTMFTGANDRVATYLRSINTKLGPATMPQALASAAPPPAAAPAKAANKALVAKPAPAKIAAAKAAATKAAATTTAQGKTPAPAFAAAPAAAAKPRKAALAATPPAAAKPTAKVSRRTDPYDRYLTMIGNQYGGGVTTLQRCKAFDAIVLSLADKTNTDRLLTMISSSLVQATLLEAIVNCPSRK